MPQLSPLLRLLFLTIAILAAAFGATSTASAADGYWRYVDTTFTPSEADFVTLGKNPGRQPERHVSGGFQAEYSGQGTVELYFKDTDIDGHTYLSRMTLTYGASADMKILVPDTRIDVQGTVGFESNFEGATGWGRIAVDNADYMLSVTTGNGEASGSGWFIVPSGAPGSTMRYVASAYISSYGGLNVHMTNSYEWVEGTTPVADQGAPPQTFTGSEILGSRIDVTEIEGWTGTWVRRPGTDIFDATWQNTNGSVGSDVIHVGQVNGRDVVLTREGVYGSYSGTVSADGRSIVGTATWYPSGATWSGTISNGNSSVVLPPWDSDVSPTPDEETGLPSDHVQWGTPAEASSAELFADNWNVATCDLTDFATLDVKRSARLDRFELWMKWSANERSAQYRVTADGRDIGGGILRREGCDPIQGAWCIGADTPDVELPRGRYEISIDHRAVCQNPESSGRGFIRAWGELERSR